MKNILIRESSVKDISLILDLIKGLAEFEKLSHEVTATPAQLEKTLFGKEKYAETVIAEYDGKPVGLALFFHNYSTFLGKPGLYLEDLFVKPEFRGNGIGKALLIYLAKLAKQRDCGRFEWSVLDWNELAIKFYLELGAKPMSDWTGYRVTGEALDALAKKEI